jgi:hypothetical protein
MALNIIIGWWILPLIITFSAGVWLAVSAASYRSTGGMFDFDVVTMMRIPLAIIVSLVAWLTWALLT